MKLFIRKLLLIGATSLISSSEAERSAPGIRRLKTAFRNIMEDEQKSNLNLLQIHTPGSNDIEILKIFIKKTPRRVFSSSLVFSKT